MIRVAIIDDENLVRIGIRSSIDWSAHDCELVGEASDGVTGLKLIQEKHPDLVFLDITMPNMDGLDLLRELKRLGITCQVVILSCHDDFNYVRKAMEYGACRYVLKNEIDDQSVGDLLASIRGRPRCEYCPEMKDQHSNLIQKICEGEDVPEQEYEAICGNYENLIAISFSIRNYDCVLERYSEAQQAVLDSRVLNFCAEWITTLPDCAGKLFQRKSNRFLLLLFSNDQGTQQDAKQILHCLRNMLNNYLNLDVYAGISSCKAAPTGFRRAILESEYARGMFFFRTEPICLYTCEEDIIRDMRVRTIMSELYDRAFECDVVQAYSLIERLVLICRDLACENVFDVASVRHCIMNAVRFLCSSRSAQLSDLVGKAETSEELLSLVKQAMMKSEPETASSTPKRTDLTRETLEYISIHFMENISLQTIAQELHVNKSHLCRVFSKDMNQSIHEYLSYYRIERAKDLIDSKNMRMYDIARRVGFQNTTHFNVTFKKWTSQTPIEYRNRVRD